MGLQEGTLGIGILGSRATIVYRGPRVRCCKRDFSPSSSISEQRPPPFALRARRPCDDPSACWRLRYQLAIWHQAASREDTAFPYSTFSHVIFLRVLCEPLQRAIVGPPLSSSQQPSFHFCTAQQPREFSYFQKDRRTGEHAFRGSPFKQYAAIVERYGAIQDRPAKCQKTLRISENGDNAIPRP